MLGNLRQVVFCSSGSLRALRWTPEVDPVQARAREESKRPGSAHPAPLSWALKAQLEKQDSSFSPSTGLPGAVGC